MQANQLIDRNEKLPVIVVYDTEHAPGYVEGERTAQSTELGLAIVCLVRVRELVEDGLSSLTAFARAMKVVHLRFIENGKWQIFKEVDRHNDRLWQAAFTEFGDSHWVYLQDLKKHIVAFVKDAMGGTAIGTEKPSIFLVAHAMSNDEKEMQKLGFCWKENFEVLNEIDTQILAWGFASTTHKPGLKTIMEELQIRWTVVTMAATMPPTQRMCSVLLPSNAQRTTLHFH
jgi:hypothetical protein